MRVSITARDIGNPMMEGFCPRCFWIQKSCPIPYDSPFRTPMPGVFSTLDAHIKRVIHESLDEEGCLPGWLEASLAPFLQGKVIGYERIKRMETNLEDDDIVITLRGAPDDIFIVGEKDDEYVIVDYKTAVWTEGQKRIAPLYQGQLNAYFYLYASLFPGRSVKGLYLIYLQPMKESKPWKDRMGIYFEPYVVHVQQMSLKDIENRIREIGRLIAEPRPPKPLPDCKGCRSTITWIRDVKERLSDNIQLFYDYLYNGPEWKDA